MEPIEGCVGKESRQFEHVLSLSRCWRGVDFYDVLELFIGSARRVSAISVVRLPEIFVAYPRHIDHGLDFLFLCLFSCSSDVIREIH